MTNSSIVLLVLILIIIIPSCSSKDVNYINKEIGSNNLINEITVTNIPLKGEISAKNSEISGMCWYGDNLILLPQYPSNFDSNIGKIFFIKRSSIFNSIYGKDTSSIMPDYYSINLDEFKDLFKIGSGFESITINENTAYFTIEHLNNGKTETILICGEIDSVRKSIELNKESFIKDPAELYIHNISDESILYFSENIIPIYEVFGKNINKNPKVSVFNNKLEFIKKIDFPNIEYRITDVTSVDETGKFWAINYFYPGDNKKLNPAEDKIILDHGIGKSHYLYDPVERLIQLQINENEIVLTDQPPIYLELMHNNSRNWEALVKFGNKGFLIATDTFPGTILAFVEYKTE